MPKPAEVDDQLLFAWLEGRSIARGLTAPIADHGGFRVDTNSEAEICRWVFAKVAPGLIDLGQSVSEPRHLLKLCGDANELRLVLPPRWSVESGNYVMVAEGAPSECTLAPGYELDVTRKASAIMATIFSEDGTVAARGYAAETLDGFIYDRIVTDVEHRRKGLGRAVMAALRSAKQNPDTLELLVATEDGKRLYTQLGWKVISPYCTASITVA